MDGGDDVLLGVGQAVDEQQGEDVLLGQALAGRRDLRLETAYGLRSPLDAELVDVGDQLAVHTEAIAWERDEQQATLHHAGWADLAGGGAAGAGDARERLN